MFAGVALAVAHVPSTMAGESTHARVPAGMLAKRNISTNLCHADHGLRLHHACANITDTPFAGAKQSTFIPQITKSERSSNDIMTKYMPRRDE